jgi:2-haloacid dehalogenase
MIRAVVFDVGRVLVGWDPEGFYDRHFGRARREAFFAAVPIHAMNIGLDRGDPWPGAVHALANAYPDWRDEILCWQTGADQMTGPPIDHTVRLLRALKARGVPVYALTNYNGDKFREGYAQFPLYGEFDGYAVSGDLRVMKPEAAIYTHIERISGLTGEDLFFTDDNAANIAAAAARGWQTHLFVEPQGLADRLVAAGLLTREQAT